MPQSHLSCQPDGWAERARVSQGPSPSNWAGPQSLPLPPRRAENIRPGKIPKTPSLAADAVPLGRRPKAHAARLRPPLPARTRSRAHATAHPHPRNPAVSSSSSPAAAAGWGADPSSAPRPIPPLPLVRPEAAAWTDSPSLFGLSLSARGGYGAGS